MQRRDGLHSGKRIVPSPRSTAILSVTCLAHLAHSRLTEFIDNEHRQWGLENSLFPPSFPSEENFKSATDTLMATVALQRISVILLIFVTTIQLLCTVGSRKLPELSIAGITPI